MTPLDAAALDYDAKRVKLIRGCALVGPITVAERDDFYYLCDLADKQASDLRAYREALETICGIALFEPDNTSKIIEICNAALPAAEHPTTDEMVALAESALEGAVE